MFDQGQGCRVSSDPVKVAPGKAILTAKNSLGVHQGDKICIKTVSNTFFVVIDRLETITDLRNMDNIVIGSPLGADTAGHYARISSWKFFLHRAFGTKKVRWSIAATCVSIISAAAASIASASKDCHDGLKCIGEVSTLGWFLVALSALSSLVAWCKDNEIF
jgi:hypothetical protein